MINYIEHITENPLEWSYIKSKTINIDFMNFMDNIVENTLENTLENNQKQSYMILEVNDSYEESYIIKENKSNNKEDDDSIV